MADTFNIINCCNCKSEIAIDDNTIYPIDCDCGVSIDRYGDTGEKWGKHQFEYEYCECGGDWDDHDYIYFLAGWFARCKAPECIGDVPNRAEGHYCSTCDYFNRCLVMVEGKVDLDDYHSNKKPGTK